MLARQLQNLANHLRSENSGPAARVNRGGRGIGRFSHAGSNRMNGTCRLIDLGKCRPRRRGQVSFGRGRRCGRETPCTGPGRLLEQLQPPLRDAAHEVEVAVEEVVFGELRRILPADLLEGDALRFSRLSSRHDGRAAAAASGAAWPAHSGRVRGRRRRRRRAPPSIRAAAPDGVFRRVPPCRLGIPT